MAGIEERRPRITLGLAGPDAADIPPSVFRDARPIVPREEVLEDIVTGNRYFDPGRVAPDMTAQQILDRLPSDHPLRSQLSETLEARRRLDMPVEPQPVDGRTTPRMLSDWWDRYTGRDALAGRTRDTRSPLDRSVSARDDLSSRISAQRTALADLQAQAERTARPEGVSPSEWEDTLAARRANVEAAQRRLDDLIAQQTPERRTRIVDEVIGEADADVDLVTARALEDPTVRDLYFRDLDREAQGVLRARRWRGRLRAAGYTGLGMLFAAGTAGGLYLTSRSNQRRIETIDLARRIVSGDITEDDMEALVENFPEDEVRQILDDAARAREEGVDVDVLEEDIDTELEEGAVPEEMVPPPTDDGGLPPGPASLDRPPSVFNPDPTTEPVLIDAQVPMREPEPVPVVHDPDRLPQYRGRTRPLSFVSMSALLCRGLLRQGLERRGHRLSQREPDREYFRDAMSDIFPETMGDYLSGENMFGDGPLLTYGDDFLERLRMPLLGNRCEFRR
jgi:hypothetical protein